MDTCSGQDTKIPVPALSRGFLFYSICSLDTPCRLPQKEGAVLTALGGPWQRWAG